MNYDSGFDSPAIDSDCDSTTQHGELLRQSVATFIYNNMAASLTNTPMLVSDVASGFDRLQLPHDVRVVSLACTNRGGITAGSATIKVYDGTGTSASDETGLAVTLDATTASGTYSSNQDTTSNADGSEIIHAGTASSNGMLVRITTDASLAPLTVDVMCHVVYEW